jgi:hypothetical protein
MFRGCAPKCCLENNAKFGEGIVQGVVKATQTGILWSQVQVLVGPPIKLGPYRPHGLHILQCYSHKYIGLPLEK